MRAEAKETVEHQTHKRKENDPDGNVLVCGINTSFALKFKKKKTFSATGCGEPRGYYGNPHMTKTWSVRNKVDF